MTGRMPSRAPMTLSAMALFAAAMLALAPPAAAATAGELFSGFSGKSKDPIQVDAEALEIHEEGDQRISVFSGGVTVIRGNATLKAATIKLYSDKKSKATSSSGFTKMEATGSVYVTSADQTVTGQTAVVDNKAQTITLTGNVVLTQGKNVITGDKLVINMVTGTARVEQSAGKRIKGVFTPDDVKKGGKDGGDKDAKPGDAKPGDAKAGDAKPGAGKPPAAKPPATPPPKPSQ